MQLVGREDVAAVLKANKTPEGEGAEVVETLIYCFNAVEDELARFYFPLKTTQTLTASSKQFLYVLFAYQPVRILSVQSNGKDVEYELFPYYMQASESTITVKYEYSPKTKCILDTSAYNGMDVSERLVAYGTASEYCLINGEVQLANLFESKYREEIDRAQQKNAEGRLVPPRRWV